MDLAEAVEAYALAVQTAASKEGGLLLGTEASSEISEQGRLGFGELSRPIEVAHSAIRLGHSYVLDCLRTLATLIVIEPPSVYGPFVVARSLLDAAGVVNWRAEPGIGADRRVQLDLVISVAEVNAQKVPDRPEFRATVDRLDEAIEQIRSLCEHQDWTFEPGGRHKPPPMVGSETVPTPKALIGMVANVQDDEVEKGLGAALWWWLSGFTHGGMDAILHTVERNPSSDILQPSGVISVRLDTFTWLIIACGRAAVALTRRRQQLFGEVEPEVEEKTQQMESQFVRFLRAVRERRLP